MKIVHLLVSDKHHTFHFSDKQPEEIEREKRRKKESEDISQHHIGTERL